jgi:dihydrofolate reductase
MNPEMMQGEIPEDLQDSLPDDAVRVSLIVAMASNRCIGMNNELPWRLPEDLKYFKQVTSGKAIIMGRATYDSLGRPLPNRTNIVMTRDANWEGPIGTRVVHSLEAALALAEAVAVSNYQAEVVVIGGAQIYAQLLPQVDRLYITEVHTVVAGDAFFPELNAADWQEISRRSCADESSDIGYDFVVYDRALGA